MALKENLKKIRKQRKLTQKELAEKCGISFSFISKLESGEQANPSLETLKKVSAVLEVEPYQLLGLDSVIAEIDDQVKELQSSPQNEVYEMIHRLLCEKAGTEYFGINHSAITPDEFETIERAIVDFIMFQFSKFKDKPSIYYKD